MTPAKFVAKWSRVTLTERGASQEHFIDLCRLLGQPTPAEHDATGAEYTFEKGVTVTGRASRGSKGDSGFADVWWRGKFGWEYKRKDKYKDLAEAYSQLLQYREALENPPLLVVSDISRTEIHTNFTGTKKQVHTILLSQFEQADKLSLLRRLFTQPESFRPEVSTVKVTEEVAKQVGELTRSLQARGHDPHTTAHFLMKCMFCLFAEDVQLLPEKLFSRLLRQWHDDSKKLQNVLTELFARMAGGGAFGLERIPWFNGGLFEVGSPSLELDYDQIGLLQIAAAQDWSSVEPAIFGTLFERSLDPSKRAQIGAHYTSREDIMLIVEPVVMAPLRRQWQEVKAQIEAQVERRKTAKTPKTRKAAGEAISNLLLEFDQRLSTVRILDPACGSGNFLYVAIQQLLFLEKEVCSYAARAEIGLGLIPQVRPTQLHGIEINPYAAELAQVVIWIGYLQWMRENGFNAPHDPILAPLKNIENRDAILEWIGETGTLLPAWKKGALTIGPAHWPDVDFIIGNPPFLGSKLFRAHGLEDDYIKVLYFYYGIPKNSDLCCYWFERARMIVENGVASRDRRFGAPPPRDAIEERYKQLTGSDEFARAVAARVRCEPRFPPRVGLLATQGIRGGDNRTVLERIKQTGDIFMAWSDREWILDGAAVHVSMIGFDDGTQKERTLDGGPVERINPDLAPGVATVDAKMLAENHGIAFMGDTKGGAFDIKWEDARTLLGTPNPNGRCNHEVVRPWSNGSDITKRARAMWVIDFGCEMPEGDASLFEKPFGLVEKLVRPERVSNRRATYAKRWWIHVEARPSMRQALLTDPYIATPNVTKHRLFVRMPGTALPDHQLIVYARSDDYFFGVLHSSIHELWALRMGTQLEDRPRYTPTTCFETFPLPWPPGEEPVAVAQPPPAGQTHPRAGVPQAAGLTHPRAGVPQAGVPQAGVPQAAVPQKELHAAISQAAKELNEMRERWLNPPEWIEPIAAAIDALDKFEDVPAEARPLIRQSAIMAAAAKDPNLKKRTLTNLYNERPTWLKLAHRKLDEAVLAAYAAIGPDGGWSPDWADVWFDTGAGQALPNGHPLTARRAEIDQKVLANLLRLNQGRSRP
jgi:hypothetical protein